MESTPGMTAGSGSTSAGPPVLEQAKEQTQQVVEQARRKGGELMDQTRTQITSRISDQKETAAGSISTVAQAIRQMGDQLRQQDQAMIAGYVTPIADAVENVSGYLREHSVEDMTQEVERFARRNPAVFLGAAFGIGLLAARFLKSSASAAARADYSTPMYGTAVMDTGANTETARGTAWSGEPTADSPRGRPMYGSAGSYDALMDDEADDLAGSYQSTGTTP